MSHQNWITTQFPRASCAVRSNSSTPRGVLLHRLPVWARQQWVDPQLTMVESQPSGVRIAFRSTATAVELDVLRSRMTYAGLPPRPDGVIELIVDGRVAGHAVTAGGITTTINMTTGAAARQVDPALPHGLPSWATR